MCSAGQGLCFGERNCVCLSEEIGQERDREERPAASLAAPYSTGLGQPRALSLRPIRAGDGTPSGCSRFVHLSHLTNPASRAASSDPNHQPSNRATKRVCVSPAPPGWAQPNHHGMTAPSASLCASTAGWEPSLIITDTELTWLSLGHPQSGLFYPIFVLISPHAAPRGESSHGTIPWCRHELFPVQPIQEAALIDPIHWDSVSNC